MNTVFLPNQSHPVHDDTCEVAYAKAAGLVLVENANPATSFDALQWLVISIGKRDAAAAPTWGPLGKAIGRLFAWQQPNKLADRKLEQLRHMAALATKLGWQIPPGEMSAFLRAGWSDDQLELLIDSVSPHLPERLDTMMPETADIAA